MAGRDILSRQYLQEMLNNDVMRGKDTIAYTYIPQQSECVSAGFRASRRPLLVLDIYRSSTEDSALSWFEWGSLEWKSNERICMYATMRRPTQALFC